MLITNNDLSSASFVFTLCVLIPPPPHTHTLHLPCSDVGKIRNGIGDKVALLLQWLTVFVGGFVVGFVRDWRLTLVLLAFTPFLAIGGFVMTKARRTGSYCMINLLEVHLVVVANH